MANYACKAETAYVLLFSWQLSSPIQKQARCDMCTPMDWLLNAVGQTRLPYTITRCSMQINQRSMRVALQKYNAVRLQTTPSDYSNPPPITRV